MPKKTERPVIVTTAHRGVFFGYAAETDGQVIDLKRAQLVIRWASDLRGFMGLASHGPSKKNSNNIIGRPANIQLRDITSVVECTEEAAKNFESFA